MFVEGVSLFEGITTLIIIFLTPFAIYHLSTSKKG